MKEALYVILGCILGWLLGLLSQPIVSRIEKYYKRNDLKTAIFSELKNLKIRLAAGCYEIQSHLGFSDKETLKWVKSVYEEHRTDCPQGVLQSINKMLQVPEKQFTLLTSLFKAEENVSLNIKTYSLSFIDSILEHLSVFDSEFQRHVLEVRAQINILNEEIKNAEFHYQLTFNPSCMSANKTIIKSNLDNCYNNIQKRCRIVVGKIDEVLKNQNS